LSFVLDRSCRQYSNCIRSLFFFSSSSLSHAFTDICLSILLHCRFHFLRFFFWSTIPMWTTEIPWGLSDNDKTKDQTLERRKKKVWKQNVCQLTPCAWRSQSVDDDHWLEVYTSNTCAMSERESILQKKIYN
jgi:hypothetical protein